MVQFSYLWANLKRVRTCLSFKNVFLCHTYAPNPTSLKAHLTVMSNNNLLVSYRICFDVANAIQSWPSIPRVTQHLFSRFARSFGHPPLYVSILPPYILPQMYYLRLAHAHYSGNFASGNTAPKLHQSLVFLFLRQQRHTATNDSTNCTSCTMEPRLHYAQEISQRSQLRNAHRDVNVGKVAANKSKYFNY